MTVTLVDAFLGSAIGGALMFTAGWWLRGRLDDAMVGTVARLPNALSRFGIDSPPRSAVPAHHPDRPPYEHTVDDEGVVTVAARRRGRRSEPARDAWRS